MYAVVKTNATYDDGDGLGGYNNVVAVQEEASGYNENIYTYFDLSLYDNGSEVQAGWRYYEDTDTFAPVPVFYYYANLDENGIVIEVIQSLDGTLASDISIIIESYDDTLLGKVYRDGVFLPVDVRIMLLVEEMSVNQNGSSTATVDELKTYLNIP